MLNEETFADRVTYPTITTVDSAPRTCGSMTSVRTRSGDRRLILFPTDGSSLQPLLHDEPNLNGHRVSTLADISLRISCGIATGVDSVFVRETNLLTPGMKRFAFPTISGRELKNGCLMPASEKSMLIPYDRRGHLLPLSELGELKTYLSRPEVKAKLEARTCVDHKPWYAFHDSAPLSDILRPKLICKDITATPHFWIDPTGRIVPRHSVYYIVPRDSSMFEELREFLNGTQATAWLQAHCQRASKGFLRLQSSVLKRLPLPDSFSSEMRTPDNRHLLRPARAA